MQNIASTIKKLAPKLHKLVDLHKKLKDENTKLHKQIASLQQQAGEQKLNVNKLQESNKVLKLAKALSGKENVAEIKSTINELVREIDKCKALLNR